MTKKQKIQLAAVPAAVVALAAGTLAVLNSAAVQRNYLVAQLRERGIDARFDEVNFGWIFSDKIELRGADFTFPHGERLRIADFSARHNGLRALFSRKPELRKISCKNATLADANGRPQIALSASADAVSADFSAREISAETAVPATFTALGARSRRFRAAAQNFRATDAAGRTLAAGTLSGEFAGAEPLALTGTLAGELAALLAQPIFADFNNVAAGAFALNAGGNSAEIALAGLRARAGNSAVREMKITLARGENATLALGAEICGAEKRVSRATLDFAELQISRGGANFAGTLRAPTLAAEDVAQAFAFFRAPEKIFPEISAAKSAAVSKKSAGPRQSAGTPKAAKAENVPAEKTQIAGTAEISPREETRAGAAQPFWFGLRGTLDFAAENLILAGNELGAHAGTLEFSDAALALESASETFYGGSLRNAARLEFSIFPPNYRLAAESVGAGVAIQRFVPALCAADSAALEGEFDFRVQLSAKADIPARLGDAPEIQFFAENSAPGHLRIFEADSKKLRRAGALARFGSGLAKMLGGAARNFDERAENFAENVETLEKTLGDFAFTRLALNGEFAAGTLVCRKIEIAGDELRLSGNAEIRPLADKELARWPLKISARTQARGALLRAFSDFGLTEKKSAAAGTAENFAFVRDIEFAGTARGAADDFWKSIRDSVLGR